MTFSRLLLINALATFAAGIVLFVQPDLISGAVGIHIHHSAYFIFYLLAASELGLAALFFRARTLVDVEARRIVSFTAIVFHAASAFAGLLGWYQGVDPAVLWNVALRLVLIALFVRVSPFSIAR